MKVAEAVSIAATAAVLILESSLVNAAGIGESCTTPSGSGTCLATSMCNGTSIAGYCPGGTDIQCCVAGEKSGLFGLDICDVASVSQYECFQSSGFGDFTVPRGFRSTGVVDTNLCTTLRSAKSAGVPFRDTYMFPCPVREHCSFVIIFFRHFNCFADLLC
jgi:hypothetical protein